MATAFSKRPGKIKQLTLSLAALLVITFSFSPIAVADETPPTDTAPIAPTSETTPTDPAPTTTETTPPPTETSPPPTDVQGPTSPTGAESDTYTYNADTGLWENSKYTWDPVTKQTAPKTAPTYSYNPETGHWDTTEWVYDAPSGKYVPNIISVLSPPEGALISESSPTPSSAKMASPAPTSSQQASSNTGPGSTNTITDHGKPKGLFDLFYNAFISNDINSSAISGDALVNMNTLAGSALSGDARSIATIFNLLQSSWNLGLVGNAFHAFTESIFGNIIGDLLLDPGYTPSTSSVTPSDITVNSNSNAAIDNTISLEAISGDASVTNNTKAGDATTGSATVIANIINAINSSIVSGQSFVGMLNIYGNLNGDILLPQNLITSLLASNAIGTLDTSQISNSEILGNFDNSSTITNTVNASATSGDASVDKNTSAGNATSGSANTNVTLLNLTGRKVIGKNALLVFVNVMGTWVGMIVDAPAGSTSAALGSGITENSSLSINDTDTKTINNTINVAATSGDATVSNNTSAGSATSGDANAAVNILNLSNSQFALSDWFGILFINVFGTWTGSFGIDTPAGTIPFGTSTDALTSTSGASQLSTQAIKAFRFTPHSDGTYALDKSNEGVAALAQAGVLSARTTPTSSDDPAHEATNKPAKSDWLMTAIGVSIAFSLLGTERILNRRAANS